MFRFHSKAETLEALTPLLRSGGILPLAHVTVARWKAERQTVLAGLAALPWAAQPLIVRSSAHGEDGAEGSEAGRFLSLMDISSQELAGAIDRVASAYAQKAGTRDDAADRILIQPMLRGVVASGVAFTRDPSTGSPYLVVEGADGTDTSAVTGGRALESWRHTIWLKGPTPLDARLEALRRLAQELIDITGLDSLDFEFALDHEERLWLLQVRPLKVRANPLDDADLDAHIQDIYHKVAAAMREHPLLQGTRTVFGVMPDWNPAEIIGTRPTPLALSLYRTLITDSIWAYQRHNYGYRNLRSFPLLVHFGGQPYVDVRVSFNSFVPRELEDDLAGKLVNHYISRLLAEPALHDKIEFEIVLSAYTFDLPERLDALRSHGFSPAERDALAESLRRLTNRIINRRSGLWQVDAEKLLVLAKRRARIRDSELSVTEKIYWLLEDAKRYGTLPFAGLARAGFIAVQMIGSLVAVGVLSEEDRNDFMAGMTTVGSELAHDTHAMDRKAFLEKYGHLRPGTYDIRVPRYDSAPELYGIGDHRGAEPPPRPRFSLSLAQMRRIEGMLDEHGLENSVVGLFDFFQAAIEGREKAKFEFTRNLSDAIELLAGLGERLGLSREDLAHADIGIIHELQASSTDPARLLAQSIALGRERYRLTQSLLLPPVIRTPDEVRSFAIMEPEPNFITLGAVTAPVKTTANPMLDGAIVCVESADPGFDWIFARGIKGLVTAYGGANSHMAIRAAELEIPAVIGAGEANYARWSKAAMLHLDCANRKVKVVR